jgi:hypothetical protein
MKLPPILDVGGVLISSDILIEYFCCDYEKCKGICCVEGDAGAPVTLDEIAAIEERLDDVWPLLSASAQSVIDRQGVAYADRDGDMVTSIVSGRECVFARSLTPSLTPAPSPKGEGSHVNEGSADPCWLCMLEKVAREKATANNSQFIKPISCALYPIREKTFADGTVALNYHRWAVCRDAVAKGKADGIRVYQFLREPLIRRFGEDWYNELCEVAALFE